MRQATRLLPRSGLYLACLLLAGCAQPVDAGSPTPTQTRVSDGEIRYWLNTNYDGAGWLKHVVQVEDLGRTVIATTDLYPDADADQPAAATCSAIRAWRVDQGRDPSGVTSVLSSTGSRIARC